MNNPDVKQLAKLTEKEVTVCVVCNARPPSKIFCLPFIKLDANIVYGICARCFIEEDEESILDAIETRANELEALLLDQSH